MNRALTYLSLVFALGSPGRSDAQAPTRLALGNEFGATVDVVGRNVRVDSQLFAPNSASPLRSAIVIAHTGLGARVFDDPEWRTMSETVGTALVLARFSSIETTAGGAAVEDQVVRNAALGGADGLLAAMRQLADSSGRPELATIPLLFWGHSAGASFGTTFAELHPQRTMAFIRYHTQRGGLSADVNRLKDIPALLIAGGKDNQNRMNDTLDLWRAGRAVGAPWTFAIEPEAPHYDEIDIRKSNRLALPWIAAIVRQRLSAAGPTLRPVSDRDGLLGDQQTLEFAARATFAGPTSETSWLPDEATARGWLAVGRPDASPLNLSLFTASSRDDREPVLGVWRGVVTMGKFQFGAEILLESLNLGQAAGRIVYLDGVTPDCGSSIVLSERIGLDTYVLAETLDAGRSCPSAGRIDIRLLGDGRLQAEWRIRRAISANSPPIGTAMFERKTQ